MANSRAASSPLEQIKNILEIAIKINKPLQLLALLVLGLIILGVMVISEKLQVENATIVSLIIVILASFYYLFILRGMPLGQPGHIGTLSTSALLCDPTVPDQYVSAWGGFEGNYYAFNPSFRAEKAPGEDESKLIDEVFVKRFKNRRFKKAYYLLFTGDPEGLQNFEDFKRLYLTITQRCPQMKSKLEVRRLEEAHPTYEYYHGTKRGIKTAVFGAPILPLIRGFDTYVLVITNPEIISNLENQFMVKWETATPVPIQEVLGIIT